MDRATMAEGRADALKPGHRLHVYTIAEVLGAGGFGITYRAEEGFTHRQVAIKEFLPNSFAFRAGDGVGVRPISEGTGNDFAWGLERFRLEAKTLYQLRHPHIVPVLQYFEANGTGYLVMEYQSGKTLGALVKPDLALDPSELEDILEPLLDGLAAVHAKGFLHRDVKPDNIFIRTDGAPLLLDFGAARQAVGARSQSLTTIISEGYAPFEQYESGGNQGPWTDIYAFGATLYRCMSGVKPVPSPARVMAQMQGARDPLPPLPPEARRRYGGRLADAVEGAMQVSMAARPQTIEALRALLREGAPAAARTAAETLVAPLPAEPAGTIALPGDEAPPPRPPPRQRPRRVEPPPAPPPAAAETEVAARPVAEVAAGAPPPRRGIVLPFGAVTVAALAGIAAVATIAIDRGSAIGYAVAGTAIALHLPLALGALARTGWGRSGLGALLVAHAFPAAVIALVFERLADRIVASASIELVLHLIAVVLGIALLIAEARLRRRERAQGLDAAASPRAGPWIFALCCAGAATGGAAGLLLANNAVFAPSDIEAFVWITAGWFATTALMLVLAALRQRWAAIVAGALMVALLAVIPLVAGYYAQFGSSAYGPSEGAHQRGLRAQAVLLAGIGLAITGALGLVLWNARSLRAWQRRRRTGAG